MAKDDSSIDKCFTSGGLVKCLGGEECYRSNSLALRNFLGT